MFAYNEKWINKASVSTICRVLSAFVIFASAPSIASAADLRLKAGVNLSLVDQKIETKGNEVQKIDSTNRIITPYVSLAYKTRKMRAFFKATNNQVRRELEDNTTTQDFMEYQYSGNYDILENILSFNASGLRSYRSNSLNSFLVDDFLLNSESLNKVTSDRGELKLNLRRGKFYGLSGSSSYSRVNSGLNRSNVVDESVFDNESYSLMLNAISGEGLDGARINLSGRVQYSKRASGQDFINQYANLSSDIETYADFGIALNATYENNEIRTDVEDANTGLREFYSVGAGLSWQPRSTRLIKVLLNRSYTASEIEGAEDEEENYLSYNVNWAFSDRTSLQGSLSRRFYGKSGNLAFLHQTRNWRSSLSYNEVVSSSSQLVNSNQIGLFICDNGSTNIADCRLSDSLTPNLGVDETLQAFVFQNLNIHDRVVLRKSLTAQSAVTRRRTTISLTATNSEDEEVENNRIYTSATLGANVAFSLSNNTTFQYNFSYSKVELDEQGELEQAISKVHSFELSRKLSRRFTTSLSFSYLDRDGEVSRGTPSLRGLNGPLTNRRITLGISYNFGTTD